MAPFKGKRRLDELRKFSVRRAETLQRKLVDLDDDESNDDERKRLKEQLDMNNRRIDNIDARIANGEYVEKKI